MKRKRIFKLSAAVVVLIAALFAFAACSGAESDIAQKKGGGDGAYPSQSAQNESLKNSVSADSAADDIAAVPERKIIYTVDCSVSTKDLDKTIEVIEGAYRKDLSEYVEYQTVNDERAYFTVRVKSDRIDEFMAAVAEGGEIYDFSKNAQDISLNYANNEAELELVMAQYTRLAELAQGASVADLILIEARKVELEAKIKNLQSIKNNYDSRVEFSSIRISVSYDPPKVSEPAFGERIATLFADAWKALGSVFVWLFYALIAVFPFALVIVPVTIGIIILIKYLKAKKAGVPFTLRRKKKISAPRVSDSVNYGKTDTDAEQDTDPEDNDRAE
ncbi:MAG: DUF4349 domain-containing protein [Clostridiales bacterium]|jgi:hypothetical protein|nr:DUF4349 domain-containing protein [Clostridiales bacterium]